MILMSTRETLEAAAALQASRSADVVLELAAMEQEMGWGAFGDIGLCAEHQAAVNRIAELHLLVDHLVGNLRGGNGVPPTPAAVPERRSMRPVVYLKQGTRPPDAQGLHHAVLRPAERTNRPAAPPHSDGWLNVAEAAKATGHSRSWFKKLRAKGRIPEPAGGSLNRPLWRAEQLEAVQRGGQRRRASA